MANPDLTYEIAAFAFSTPPSPAIESCYFCNSHNFQLFSFLAVDFFDLQL